MSPKIKEIKQGYSWSGINKTNKFDEKDFCKCLNDNKVKVLISNHATKIILQDGLWSCHYLERIEFSNATEASPKLCYKLQDLMIVKFPKLKIVPENALRCAGVWHF